MLLNSASANTVKCLSRQGCTLQTPNPLQIVKLPNSNRTSLLIPRSTHVERFNPSARDAKPFYKSQIRLGTSCLYRVGSLVAIFTRVATNQFDWRCDWCWGGGEYATLPCWGEQALGHVPWNVYGLWIGGFTECWRWWHYHIIWDFCNLKPLAARILKT